MQVKKYEASSILEALQLVKKDLGPDAIILSSQETKKSLPGAKKFTVVAAVSEHHLKKKELAEKKLGEIFETKVTHQSANKQKLFIDSIYGDLERKQQKKEFKITQTPYINIGEEDLEDRQEEVVQSQSKNEENKKT